MTAIFILVAFLLRMDCSRSLPGISLILDQSFITWEARMKAIRIHQFGPTEEVLQYEDVPIPDPAANEILIKVEAAPLTRADLGLRKGTYRVSPEELPIIPGREFAGTVVKIGATVKEFKVGARVVAYTGMGGYAEYAVAK